MWSIGGVILKGKNRSNSWNTSSSSTSSTANPTRTCVWSRTA